MNILLQVLGILGGLGLFIYGMKTMSEGIQQIAGRQMRTILQWMTKNRGVGVLSGFVITGIIQSSSAVTVLTVGLVNAGMLTVLESMSFIIGANIGTSITGWIVASLGFSIQIKDLALPLVALGLPLILSKRSKLVYFGQTIIGLALFLIGLVFMRDAFPDLSTQPGLISALKELSTSSFSAVLIFLSIGVILTALVQSSSALMALVLVMSVDGYLSFSHGCALLLGANIGTTVTANIAAVIGNRYAKQTAFWHFLFNVLGVIIILPFFGHFLRLVDWVSMTFVFQKSAFTHIEALPVTLSVFHTVFNLTTAILLIGALNWISRWLDWLIPASPIGKDSFQLTHHNYSVQTPELNIYEAQRATISLGKEIGGMAPKVIEMLRSTDEAGLRHLYAQVCESEETADEMEREISGFLDKIAAAGTSKEVAIQINKLHIIVHELERIGDLFFTLGRQLEQKYSSKIWFSPEQREKLIEMANLLHSSLQTMVSNLKEAENNPVNLRLALEHEDLINAKRQEMRAFHQQSIHDEDYNIEAGIIFHQLTATMERIGDHVLNVSETL